MTLWIIVTKPAVVRDVTYRMAGQICHPFEGGIAIVHVIAGLPLCYHG